MIGSGVAQLMKKLNTKAHSFFERMGFFGGDAQEPDKVLLCHSFCFGPIYKTKVTRP
jgi:hypothetical protein